VTYAEETVEIHWRLRVERGAAEQTAPDPLLFFFISLYFIDNLQSPNSNSEKKRRRKTQIFFIFEKSIESNPSYLRGLKLIELEEESARVESFAVA